MAKKDKVVEPEFYTSATNIPTINYRVYNMKFGEKLLYFLIAFVAGAVVGYLFYGGIGKDEFGQATTLTWVLNISISVIVGIVAGYLFVPMRRKSIIEKRRAELRRQFRDMLDSLTTSIGAGKNITDSMYAVHQDMMSQYGEDSYIVKETAVIISGIQNNVAIEDVLEDFGRRSDIDDISSFAQVFKISYRKGGNIKDIIRSTHEIISDKMAIGEDIETLLTANKGEQNMMMVMPIMLVAMLKFSSPDFAANFATPTGIISTTISVVIFVVSYFVGKKVIAIKL